MKKLLFILITMLLVTNCFAQLTLSEAKSLINFANICLQFSGSNNQKCPSCNKVSITKNYNIGTEIKEMYKYHKYLSIFYCEHCKYIQFWHLYFNQNNILVNKQSIFKSK